MKPALTVDEIINDIEFEIAQGIVAHDDLGEAVQAAQQFQNKLRGELLLANGRVADPRTVITRQLQLNDILLTLAQVMTTASQGIQLSLRRLSPRVSAISGFPVKPPEGTADAALGLDLEAANSHELDDQWGLRGTQEVEKAMQPEAVRVDLAAVPSRVPLVGWLITRIREILFHVLPWSYVHRFAERQAPINRAYGEWLLRLVQQNQAQHQQIQALTAQVDALQAHVDRLNNSIKTNV